jgi:TonB-linked SusC/RagA family outer membrane protein
MKNNLLKRFLPYVKIFLIGYTFHLFLVGMTFAKVNQGVVVTGQVTSADEGESLPGVNIIEKGTSNGVVTDLDGSFSISVNTEATLIFSSVGYVTQEIAVGNQSVINIALELDVTQLEELVVVGYGTVKKSNLTGSVSSIAGDDLKQVPVATVGESLTGRVAGVQVTTTEGSPDAEVRIRVRGGASLTQDSAPLYIVDGFPVNSISDLSSSDIQSIDVLKDASSTAIYGSRGANGVVIITTKGGKAGKLSVNFNTFFGAKEIAKTLDVLTPGDYARWQYEYAVLDDPDDLSSYEDYFGLFQDIDLYEGLEANDWQRQIYGRTGQVLSNDLSIRGGSEKFNYSANFARFSERAIMIGSDYVRNNINLKMNNKPNDKVDLMFSFRYSDTNINGGGANEQNEVSSADSRLKHAVGYSPIPIAGVSVPDDTDEQISTDLVNPIIATDDNDRVQTRKNFNIGGSFAWKIINNLQFKTEFGVDNFLYSDSRFYGRTTYYVRNAPALENQNLPAARLIDRKEYRLRSTNTITYDVLEDNTHNLRLLVGQEALHSEINQLTNILHGYPALFTSEEAFKLTTQGVPFSTDNNFSPDDKLLSFFARANYEFKDRYLLTAVYRADGSSRFLGDNVWGYFPSVSAGWKISEEDFMQGTKGWLDQLKLRASYGLAGNNNIPRGQTVQSFISSTTSWINDVASYWAASKTMSNPDLKWETTSTRNIGLDFGILQGRVNGTVEVYQNNTEDLLINFPVPGTGYDYQYRNMGETENKGLEVSLNVIAIDKEKYGLNFNFNISFNKNKINSLGVMEELAGGEVTTGWASTQIANDFLARVGDPIGMMYGYVNDGRYEVSDFEGYDESADEWILKEGVADSDFLTVRPGVIKLRDLDGDNVVTIDDRQFIGDANPKNTGGFVLNGYAFGFDLMAAFNWSYGNDIYNANKIEFTTSNQNNQYRNLIDMQTEGQRWTNIDWNTGELVNDPETLTAMNANTTMWSPFMDRYVFSDWAVEDGSFLRLNTLTLGYTLPSTITERLKIQNLRFYATGYNVFILTNYSGFDPEVSTRRRTPLTPGVDYSAYPRSKQITVGLNLTF